MCVQLSVGRVPHSTGLLGEHDVRRVSPLSLPFLTCPCGRCCGLSAWLGDHSNKTNAGLFPALTPVHNTSPLPSPCPAGSCTLVSRRAGHPVLSSSWWTQRLARATHHWPQSRCRCVCDTPWACRVAGLACCCLYSILVCCAASSCDHDRQIWRHGCERFHRHHWSSLQFGVLNPIDCAHTTVIVYECIIHGVEHEHQRCMSHPTSLAHAPTFQCGNKRANVCWAAGRRVMRVWCWVSWQRLWVRHLVWSPHAGRSGLHSWPPRHRPRCVHAHLLIVPKCCANG